MIVIRERDNWMIVDHEGDVVFEGDPAGFDGTDLVDILKATGVEVELIYTPGNVPKD